MSDAVVARLEAVATRLEAAAAKMGRGGGGGGADDDVPVYVEDYDAFMNEHVKPFIALCGKIAEAKQIGEWTNTAFTFQRKGLVAVSKCKKPSQSELQAFLKPIVDVVTAAQDPDKRDPDFNHRKSFAEMIMMMNWWFAPGPDKVVRATLEQADFYMNKVLVAAKGKGDEEKKANQEWVKTVKALIPAFADLLKQHFKTGLIWNNSGGDISSFSGGGGVPAPPAGGPPAAPTLSAEVKSAPAKAAAGGLGAVFGEINKMGFGGVTKGLKKVTSDMKTKNMKDRPAAPKPKPKPKPVVKKVTAAKKPPATTYAKGTWFVENYDEMVEVKDVQMKHNVFINNCSAPVVINGKVKSVTINNCKKAKVQLDEVVSVVEIVNCVRLTVYVQTAAPTVTADKCSGVNVVLSEAAMASPPQLIYSTTNEFLVTVPGATPEADPVEHALPEQLSVTIDAATKKPTTSILEHHG